MIKHYALLFALLPLSALCQAPVRLLVKLAPETEIAPVPITAKAMIGVADVDRLSSSLAARYARRITPRKSGVPALYVIEFPPGTDAAAAMNAYRLSGRVARVSLDAMGQGGGDRSFVPDDPHYDKQWGLKNDGTFALSPAVAGADIDMESAWEIEQGSPDVTVAIIDSGVRMQHPDWDDRLWTNTDEIAGNSIDDDGNGFIDDWRGWDFANNDNDPSDDQGHGTNVTTVVAASGNNALGFTGVDLNCKAMVLKALNSANQGWYSWWIDAMYYAIANGADVISMSMGGTDASPEMQDAVDYAVANGVLVVACMMNTNSNTPYFPAALNGVMAVGATEPNDSRAVPFNWSPTSGSNFGSHISVCAPGAYIYGFSHANDVAYTVYWSGTSQATPHVSALAALLKSQQPSRTPAEIRSIIESTAEDQVGDPLEDTPGWDQYHGHGRINAFQALAQFSGVSEAARPLILELFPNPSRGEMNLRCSTQGTLTFIDGSGREVLRQRVAAGASSLRAELSPGLYTAVLLGSEGQQGSLRVQIQ